MIRRAATRRDCKRREVINVCKKRTSTDIRNTGLNTKCFSSIYKGSKDSKAAASRATNKNSENLKIGIPSALVRVMLAFFALAIAFSGLLIKPGISNAKIVIPTNTELDEAFTETVQIPITLFDYGMEVNGTWQTNNPTVLNEGLESAVSTEVGGLANVPRTMFFWDSAYRSWDSSNSDYSSFVNEDGIVLRGGQLGWGLFNKKFTDWSSIIAVPSRDLFSTTTTSYNGQVYKQVYENVMMDFSYDPENKIYHYSSLESIATFDESSNRIIKEELSADASRDERAFWPFGQGNVHFGLTMDVDFYLPSQEYLESNDYYFLFSGDDDLVVYIDDTLALDLGGASGATPGYIDFVNEIVVYGRTDGKLPGEYESIGSYQDQYESFMAHVDTSIFRTDGFDEVGIDWTGTTIGYVTFEDLGIDLENGTTHNLKLAYMERGGDDSNLIIEMRMDLDGSIAINKQSSNPDITDGNDMYSLEGAVYGVYSSETDAYDQSNALTTLTTDSNGYAQVDGLVQSTYYVREITPCPGYLLDDTIYTVAVEPEQVTYVGDDGVVYEEPENPDIEIIKSSDPESGSQVNGEDVIVYTLSIPNTGNVAVTDIVITDPIPVETDFVENSITLAVFATDATDTEDESQEVLLETERDMSAWFEDGSVIVSISELDVNERLEISFAVTVQEMDGYGSREIINLAYLEAPIFGDTPIESNETVHYQEKDEPVVVEEPETDDVETNDTQFYTGKTGSIPKTGDFILGLLIALGCVAVGVTVLLVTLRAGRGGRS